MPPSSRQERVTTATGLLFRKKAVPLVPRTTRPKKKGDRTDCVAVFDQHLRHRFVRSPKLDGWQDLPRGLHDLTSNEQCTSIGAVSHTGNARTLSRALEVVGCVSPFGKSPDCWWFHLRRTVSQGLRATIVTESRSWNVVVPLVHT